MLRNNSETNYPYHSHEAGNVGNATVNSYISVHLTLILYMGLNVLDCSSFCRLSLKHVWMLVYNWVVFARKIFSLFWLNSNFCGFRNNLITIACYLKLTNELYWGHCVNLCRHKHSHVCSRPKTLILYNCW